MQSEFTSQFKSEQALISRGAYLVEIMDCATCHSPKLLTPFGPVPDTSVYMGGHLADQPLPVYDKDMVKSGDWALSNGSITAFVGPWGTSYAANLTPDETGIGNWTLEQFGKAIREGKYKGLEGTRPIMPPMGWEAFSHLTDEDVEAIFTYLKTLKKVRNVVPPYEPID